MKSNNFWKGKRVFLTGHTGFKGGWLALWLDALGANVTGYSLAPSSDPNLYQVAGVEGHVHSVIGDIREHALLNKAISEADPEIVFHMAAQSLVRPSYIMPVETFDVNIMGTVYLLDMIRMTPGVRVFINITSDKCYENRELDRGYREGDMLGGYDPYSCSKACSELVTAAYRSSFFSEGKTVLATVRAGNVIGGGDWSVDRLVPDCIRALLSDTPLVLRNPHSIRPWQHVLEPLSGYLLLAERLFNTGHQFAGAWNFGPRSDDARSVEHVVLELCKLWGKQNAITVDTNRQLHEAKRLALDCSKANRELGWHPRWSLAEALEATIEWVKAYKSGADMHEICLSQIEKYIATDPVSF